MDFLWVEVILGGSILILVSKLTGRIQPFATPIAYTPFFLAIDIPNSMHGCLVLPAGTALTTPANPTSERQFTAPTRLLNLAGLMGHVS